MSLISANDFSVAVFPAASEALMLIVMLPSEAPDKSMILDQLVPEQEALVVTAPVKLMVIWSSEHAPLMVNAA